MILFSIVACLPTTESEVAQLESATVDLAACTDDYDTCDVSASGALAVTSSEGESALDLSITVGEEAIAVHSPSGADLSAFVGTEVSASVKGDWMVPRSLELRDDLGVIYVVETGEGQFDAVPVTYGEELGSMIDDADYELTFHTIDVTTDDGVVSVAPGEIKNITVSGVAYRFAAIAAYEVDVIPGGDYADCGGEAPLLSYELLRVDTPVAEEKLTRPEGLEMARFSGCG